MFLLWPLALFSAQGGFEQRIAEQAFLIIWLKVFIF